MTTQLRLLDHAARDDLRIFLERVLRFGEPEVRLVERENVLAAFGCTQAPLGLFDSVAVVLVTRGFGLQHSPHSDTEVGADVTVSARALLDRIARMGVLGLTLDLPESTVSTAWAGVLPPHSGWEAVGAVEVASLAQVAKQGIERVASLLPDQPGEAVVRGVRARVWGAEIAPQLPAAAAFAAESMGFLGDEDRAILAHTPTWVRLATSRGQVLVRKNMG